MLEILPYTLEQKKRFDDFVLNDSINGTFLQTQNFLEYHPTARFEDASLLCHNSGIIYAAILGAKIGDEFISHPGTTFGGPIISPSHYTGNRVQDILKTLDNYLSIHYKKAKIRITPAIFSKESPDLLEYTLEHLGYFRKTELSSYTPLNSNEDPLIYCDKECRRIFRKASDFSIEYRDFQSIHDFEIFYEYLKLSKAKYNVAPVHTLEELLELTNKRIPENIRFRGIWHNGIFVAGMMFFIFPETKNIHAQYIATNPDFLNFQPATAIYIYAMREAAKEGFKNISWGISTENQGNFLNLSLLHFKESFGAKHSANVIYTKNF